MSVYLSVARPTGSPAGATGWDRWLREHPWEAAERVCSRGDWAIFSTKGGSTPSGEEADRAAPGELVNERPLSTSRPGT